jgi:hypothetical protein
MEYLQNKIANIKNGKTPVEMVRKMLDAINNRIQ